PCPRFLVAALLGMTGNSWLILRQAQWSGHDEICTNPSGMFSTESSYFSFCSNYLQAFDCWV
ncbi:MAG: hypothetical protein ACE5JL_17755, partial [Dehalococcoidia bacterium]